MIRFAYPVRDDGNSVLIHSITQDKMEMESLSRSEVKNYINVNSFRFSTDYCLWGMPQMKVPNSLDSASAVWNWVRKPFTSSVSEQDFVESLTQDPVIDETHLVLKVQKRNGQVIFIDQNGRSSHSTSNPFLRVFGLELVQALNCNNLPALMTKIRVASPLSLKVPMFTESSHPTYSLFYPMKELDGELYGAVINPTGIHERTIRRGDSLVDLLNVNDWEPPEGSLLKNMARLSVPSGFSPQDVLTWVNDATEVQIEDRKLIGLTEQRTSNFSSNNFVPIPVEEPFSKMFYINQALESCPESEFSVSKANVLDYKKLLRLFGLKGKFSLLAKLNVQKPLMYTVGISLAPFRNRIESFISGSADLISLSTFTEQDFVKSAGVLYIHLKSGSLSISGGNLIKN
jgi:hypothetical protein